MYEMIMDIFAQLAHQINYLQQVILQKKNLKKKKKKKKSKTRLELRKKYCFVKKLDNYVVCSP